MSHLPILKGGHRGKAYSPLTIPYLPNRAMLSAAQDSGAMPQPIQESGLNRNLIEGNKPTDERSAYEKDRNGAGLRPIHTQSRHSLLKSAVASGYLSRAVSGISYQLPRSLKT